MTSKRIFIIETETYNNSLIRLKDPEIIRRVLKKVNKLTENPNIAKPMMKQHFGICEIKVTDKYRVYCIKKERAIILFILGPAIHHKSNYKDNAEYLKLFNQLRKIEKEFDETIIDDLEESLG